MSATPPEVTPPPIHYPDSDGEPMADNTKQARWITVLYGNLSALFRDRPDVFVAADLLWYPVEGEPDVRVAPDALVVIGRPKGDRGSYRQWEEGGVPLTVAFEVLSPGNDPHEMGEKYLFYEEHGVEEYYVYDPDEVILEVYVRKGSALRRVRPADGFLSPCLGVRFDLSSGPEMVVYYPDGRRFLTFEELAEEREQERKRAEDESRRADDAEKRADDEKKRADDEKRRADDEKRRADDARRLAARVAELSRKARQGRAAAEEVAELERLEGELGGPA